MKTLLVLRHAKASPDCLSGSDFDRPLTARGHRACAAIGRELRASDRRVDAIVASPAMRVLETVGAVVEAAGLTVTPVWEQGLYDASVENLIENIAEFHPSVGAAMIVGHNPGLQQLILHLAKEDRAGLRGQVGDGFPTAALAELRLSIDDWRDVGPRCGGIQSVVRPKDLNEAPAQPD